MLVANGSRCKVDCPQDLIRKLDPTFLRDAHLLAHKLHAATQAAVFCTQDD